jgi:hypothetical protein
LPTLDRLFAKFGRGNNRAALCATRNRIPKRSPACYDVLLSILVRNKGGDFLRRIDSMKNAKRGERGLHLEEAVLDELDRTVICGETDTQPALTPEELQGPQGRRRCQASERELLRNQFPQD